jgi:RND family efflux transporter MFP subunit
MITMRSLLLLAAAMFVVSGCRPSTDKSAKATAPAVSLRCVRVEEVTSPAPVPVSGVVRAGRQSLISAQVMGNVVEVPARLGATVAAGDVLARLSSDEMNARLAQAKAALSEIERTFAEESRLLEKGASTRSTVAGLRDRQDAARANVSAVQASVDHLTVRAPFAGVVSSKLVDVGDLATPGRPLLEVHSTEGAEIESGISTIFPALSVGAEVAFEVAGRKGVGRVKELATSADVQTLNRRLVLSVAGAGFAPGTPATVFWPGEARRRLLIPAAALQHHGQLERVWVVGAEGRLALRLVRVAGVEAGKHEVVSGLSAGEIVVAEPTSDLVEGTSVTQR